MQLKPRLFLDTSVLFAGIWSAEGGARMLLRLGEAEAVQLLVSSQVLQEIEEVVRRKAAHHLPTLAVLIDRTRASVVTAAPDAVLARCQALIFHPGDAHILADAWHGQAEYQVTLDKTHFLDLPGLAGSLPFPLGTPGDCLAWYRGKLLERQAL
jgi:predicted nucleic acid-binding protein